MIPANDSPFWHVLMVAVVGSMLTGLLAFGYKNGWSNQDYITVISTVGTIVGVLLTKYFVAPPAKKDP